jgi:hypothetical protein
MSSDPVGELPPDSRGDALWRLVRLAEPAQKAKRHPRPFDPEDAAVPRGCACPELGEQFLRPIEYGVSESAIGRTAVPRTAQQVRHGLGVRAYNARGSHHHGNRSWQVGLTAAHGRALWLHP